MNWRNRRLRALAIALMVLASGCQRSAPQPQSEPGARLPCLNPDSGAIAFGEIAISPETEDAAGVQFTFRQDGDSLKGFVRDARGEIPRARPLQEVTLDPLSDTVTFWYASGAGARYIYRYRLTCSELSGVARRFVTATERGVSGIDTVRRATRIDSP